MTVSTKVHSGHACLWLLLGGGEVTESWTAGRKCRGLAVAGSSCVEP